MAYFTLAVGGVCVTLKTRESTTKILEWEEEREREKKGKNGRKCEQQKC